MTTTALTTGTTSAPDAVPGITPSATNNPAARSTGDNLSAAQLALNRQSAEHLALNQTGLDGANRASWTYEQRTQFNKVLADFILKYPQRFSTADLQRAGAVKVANYTPLDNADFSWSDFASQTGANALAGAKAVGDAVVAGGKGILNTVSTLGALLPVFAVGAVLLIGFMFYKGGAKGVAGGVA